MVTDEVWSVAGLKDDDDACQLCLARRLGRVLVREDYIDCPLNYEAVPQFFPSGSMPAEFRDDVNRELIEYGPDRTKSRGDETR